MSGKVFDRKAVAFHLHTVDGYFHEVRIVDEKPGAVVFLVLGFAFYKEFAVADVAALTLQELYGMAEATVDAYFQAVQS